MYTDVATGLNIVSEDEMYPVKWDDWLKLPIREGDTAIHTTHGAIRIPTVIVLAKFSLVPPKTPTMTKRNVVARDKYTCQYCYDEFEIDKLNMDHVYPRDRGGQRIWENIVCSCIPCNSFKRNRTPEEAGMKLLKKPKAPPPVPITVALRNERGIKDWNLFLYK
jgi:5-methylcytosine-specific restriction endonuclease McrA